MLGLPDGLAQVLMTLIGSTQQQDAFDEATAANKGLENEIRGIFAGADETDTEAIQTAAKSERAEIERRVKELRKKLTKEQKAVFDRLVARNQEGQQGYGFLSDAVLGDIGTTEKGVLGELTGLRERNLARLEGGGKQQRADIEEAYAGRESEVMQDLLSRGLGSTTVAPSMKLGVERERTGALNRLEEALRREFIDVDTAGTGAVASAMERLGAIRANARQGIGLSALDSFGRGTGMETALQSDQQGARFGLDTDAMNAMLAAGNKARYGPIEQRISNRNSFVNFLNSIQNEYPQSNAWSQIAQQMGANSAPEPEGPEWYDAFLGGAGQAVGTGGGIAFKNLIKLCIDGEAMVATPHGRKKMKNIRVGDEVQTGNGVFDRVVAKDFGKTWPERFNDFVQIKEGKRTLVCTYDHVVNGLPAGQWPSATKVNHRPCGDLKLEICDSYVVNGFVVQSMFPAYENQKVTATDAH